jgi:hypothetical protein
LKVYSLFFSIVFWERTIVYAVLKFDEIICYKDSSCSTIIAEIAITPSTDVQYTLEDPGQEVKHFRFCVANEVDEMNLATRLDSERELWRGKIIDQVASVNAARNSQIQILSSGSSSGSNRRRRTRARPEQESGTAVSKGRMMSTEPILEDVEFSEKVVIPEKSTYKDEPRRALSTSGAAVATTTSNKRAMESTLPTDGSSPILSGFMEKEGHFVRNWYVFPILKRIDLTLCYILRCDFWFN